MKQNIKRTLVCTLLVCASSKIQLLKASESDLTLSHKKVKAIPNLKAKLKKANGQYKTGDELYTFLKAFVQDAALDSNSSTYNNDLRSAWGVARKEKLHQLDEQGIAKGKSNFTEADMATITLVMQFGYQDVQKGTKLANASIIRNAFKTRRARKLNPEETEQTKTRPTDNKTIKKSSFNKLRWLIGSGAAAGLFYIIHSRYNKPEKTTKPVHTK